MSENLSVQKTIRYGGGFLVFAAAVSFLVLKGTDMRIVWEALSKASLAFLAAGILLAEVFHLAEGMNLRILLRAFGYPVTFWQGDRKSVV